MDKTDVCKESPLRVHVIMDIMDNNVQSSKMAGIFMAPMKLIFHALYLQKFSLKGHDFAFEDTTCQNGNAISPSRP